jgi:uncharacterized protein
MDTATRETPLPTADIATDSVIEPVNAPVTVVVTRRVKAGHEKAYDDWLQRLTTQARSLPGYLGTDIVRPGAGGPREYTSIFRFDSVGNLRAFEASKMRAQYLAEVAPHVEADAIWREMTGLEFWFSPPPGTLVPQPSRARMAVVMVCVVFGLVLVLGQVVNALLTTWPYPLRLLLTISIEVVVMTYWLMPRLTRWLAWWIYPRTRVV